MRIFTNQALSASLNGYVYLDNDFLGHLYTLFLNSESDFFSLLSENFSNSLMMIDSLTKFEFLRDVFLKEEKELKETFVGNTKVFTPAIDSPITIKKVRDNALIISLIYANKNIKGVDIVDLHLVGRLLLNVDNSIIITGNKKHFPIFLFDTLDLINFEQDNGVTQTFYLLKVSTDKLDMRIIDLADV